ncbi:hypothetical protein GpartN1_g4883.t1 [Galdieria partita]|uniref:Uncharacterized protein n=1 Tax=Galdieria partita TaxID=83374 RepID=A0A9C7Q0X3_9RHOD|nr:hypothetical protein GpartN1_g4883.t1 [Galdieria partita]
MACWKRSLLCFNFAFCYIVYTVTATQLTKDGANSFSDTAKRTLVQSSIKSFRDILTSLDSLYVASKDLGQHLSFSRYVFNDTFCTCTKESSDTCLVITTESTNTGPGGGGPGGGGPGGGGPGGGGPGGGGPGGGGPGGGGPGGGGPGATSSDLYCIQTSCVKYRCDITGAYLCKRKTVGSLEYSGPPPPNNDPSPCERVSTIATFFYSTN